MNTTAQKRRGLRVGVVVSEFNHEITERLWRGCRDVLTRARCQTQCIKVPGAFEIPGVLARMMRRGGSAAAPRPYYDGLIALGCVIKGETQHFELVARQAAWGAGKLAAKGVMPVIFGVLAVETRAQALSRSGGRKGHFGRDAAQSLLKMIDVYNELWVRRSRGTACRART